MARNKKIKIKFRSEDYTNELLPKTRRSQFKDILLHEYKTILLIGVWLLIFFIPFIVMEMFFNIFLYTYLEQNSGGLTPEEAKSFELMINMIKEGSLVISFMILSIGIAGSLRIIRNLVYGEAIFFKDDFLLGIKKYWKVCLLSSLVFGLFKGATNILLFVTNNYANQSYLNGLSGFALGFFYILIIPLIFFFISLYITYDLSFSKNLSIAMRFTLANLLVALAFSAFLFAYRFIYYIGILLVVVTILIISMLFIAPLYILLWHLYVIAKFDKHINETQFPTIYKKGLQKGE